jgi:hypothetical protein
MLKIIEKEGIGVLLFHFFGKYLGFIGVILAYAKRSIPKLA